MLFAGVSFAQVGESKPIDKVELIGIANRAVGLPKLESIKTEDQNLFLLTFYNLEYPALREIETISFYGSNEDLNYVYNFLEGQLKSNESKTLVVGQNELMATKVSSSVRVDIMGSDRWFYLSKKQLNNLFNRS